MKRIAIATVLSALAVVPSASAEVPPALAERVIKVIERMANDVDTHKPDCDKIGTALMKHADDDVAALKAAKKNEEGKTAEQKQADKDAMQKKYGARLAAAEKKMEPLGACQKNATVKAYMAKVSP